MRRSFWSKFFLLVLVIFISVTTAFGAQAATMPISEMELGQVLQIGSRQYVKINKMDLFMAVDKWSPDFCLDCTVCSGCGYDGSQWVDIEVNNVVHTSVSTGTVVNTASITTWENGYQNTTYLLNRNYSPADTCRALGPNWYLPSIRELVRIKKAGLFNVPAYYWNASWGHGYASSTIVARCTSLVQIESVREGKVCVNYGDCGSWSLDGCSGDHAYSNGEWHFTCVRRR